MSGDTQPEAVNSAPKADADTSDVGVMLPVSRADGLDTTSPEVVGPTIVEQRLAILETQVEALLAPVVDPIVAGGEGLLQEVIDFLHHHFPGGTAPGTPSEGA